VELLDQAAAVDPAGDGTAEVEATRARAAKGQDEEDHRRRAKP